MQQETRPSESESENVFKSPVLTTAQCSLTASHKQRGRCGGLKRASKGEINQQRFLSVLFDAEGPFEWSWISVKLCDVCVAVHGNSLNSGPRVELFVANLPQRCDILHRGVTSHMRTNDGLNKSKNEPQRDIGTRGGAKGVARVAPHWPPQVPPTNY